MKILNVDGTNYNQYFSQILDSVEYIIHVYYNTRLGWCISFYDSDLFDEDSDDNDDALIYGGRRLMPNQDVLARVSYDNLPQGQLWCVDMDYVSVADLDPLTIDNFGIGQRYKLVYFTEEDVETYLS